MEIMRKYATVLSVLLFMAASLLQACTKHEYEPEILLSGDVEVTLEVSVPAKSLPASRALSPQEEDDVKSIEVMVFEQGATGRYLYTAYGYDLTDVPATDKKRFTVKLAVGACDLMVLANSRGHIETCFPAGISKHESRSNVIAGLTVSNSSGWNTDPSGSYHIPMWGIIGGANISENTSLPSAARLSRMLAKVDVKVAVAAQSTFKLSSVNLYNYNTKGQIIPNIGKWDSSGEKVTDVSIPAGARPTPTDPPAALVYDGLNTNITDVQCLDEIYMFEAEEGVNTSSHTSNPCVVIGGLYNGSTYYYRVDFKDRTTEAHMAVKRNHHYTVIVEDISGPGFTSPEAALKSRPVNVQAGVIQWNDNDLGEIIYTDYSYLSYNKKDWTLSREKRSDGDVDNKLIIDTDIPAWSLTVTASDGVNPAPWLQPSVTNGGSGRTVVSLNTVDENPGPGSRVAIIHGVAGEVPFAITVTQTDQSLVALRILDPVTKEEIHSLEFLSHVNGTVPSQDFEVEWYPNTASVEITVLPFGLKAFDFAGVGGDQITSGQTISDPSGSKAYTICPPRMQDEEVNPNKGGMPSLEKSSLVSFKIRSSDGNEIIRNIVLRQKNYGIWVNTEKMYLMDGSEYTLYVQSSVPWKITSINDPYGRISNTNALRGLTGSENVSPGTPITIKSANNLAGTKTSGSVSFIFEDTSGKSSWRMIYLEMMNCGKNGTFTAIPIGNEGYSNSGYTRGDSYLTHAYGNTCWMMQNSREVGTFDVGRTVYTTFPYMGALGERGFYYDTDLVTATNACPPGWRLPTVADFQELQTYSVAAAEWYSAYGGENSAGYYYMEDRTNPNSYRRWEHWGMRSYDLALFDHNSVTADRFHRIPLYSGQHVEFLDFKTLYPLRHYFAPARCLRKGQ